MAHAGNTKKKKVSNAPASDLVVSIIPLAFVFFIKNIRRGIRNVGKVFALSIAREKKRKFAGFGLTNGALRGIIYMFEKKRSARDSARSAYSEGSK